MTSKTSNMDKLSLYVLNFFLQNIGCITFYTIPRCLTSQVVEIRSQERQEQLHLTHWGQDKMAIISQNGTFKCIFWN